MSKIILCITDNVPDQVNGVVTTYKNIEKYAIQDGFKFIVFHPDCFTYIDFPFYKEVKITFPQNFDKKFKKINPDYVHISTEGPLGLYALYYMTSHNIQFITSYHTKYPEFLSKITSIPPVLSWRYLSWFHNKSQLTLSTTQNMVQTLKKNGCHGHIIPWTRGIDHSIFNSSLRQRKRKKNLLCVSRISKEKSLEDFFNLDFPGYQKIMVGDGPMLETYKKTYPHVFFVGLKKGVELAEYYANADVFVFPSTWETFGIVIIEAMGCGTPVAAYPCESSTEIIEEGTTGCVRNNLKDAVDACLKLNRKIVEQNSYRWSWENCWIIFRDSLIGLKNEIMIEKNGKSND